MGVTLECLCGVCMLTPGRRPSPLGALASCHSLKTGRQGLVHWLNLKIALKVFVHVWSPATRLWFTLSYTLWLLAKLPPPPCVPGTWWQIAAPAEMSKFIYQGFQLLWFGCVLAARGEDLIQLFCCRSLGFLSRKTAAAGGWLIPSALSADGKNNRWSHLFIRRCQNVNGVIPWQPLNLASHLVISPVWLWHVAHD